MKINGNFILGAITSCVLLFLIFWMVQIQTKQEREDITDTVISERVLKRSIARGKELFIKEDCYSCHKPDKLQTPSSMKLINISDIRDKKWLFRFIKDEKSLLEVKDSEVLELKKIYKWANGKHDKKHLTDDQLNEILYYLDSFKVN